MCFCLCFSANLINLYYPRRQERLIVFKLSIYKLGCNSSGKQGVCFPKNTAPRYISVRLLVWFLAVCHRQFCFWIFYESQLIGASEKKWYLELRETGSRMRKVSSKIPLGSRGIIRLQEKETKSETNKVCMKYWSLKQWLERYVPKARSKGNKV